MMCVWLCIFDDMILMMCFCWRVFDGWVFNDVFLMICFWWCVFDYVFLIMCFWWCVFWSCIFDNVFFDDLFFWLCIFDNMFDDVFLTICFFIMCLFWTCRRCALAWCPSAYRGPSSPALSAWSPTTCSCGRCSRWWTRRGTVASRSATSSTRLSSSPRAAARIRLGSYRGI